MNEQERGRWRRAKEIFEAACEASASGQQRIVEEMAGGDAELAADVQRLLAMQNDSGLTLDSPAQPLGPGMYAPGEVLAERYRVERYLASGGMGDVYEATDERSGQRVALKFVRPFAASQSDVEARFVREVRLAQKIDHPNVCKVLGLEMHRGVRFCVMELLEGETLADRLKACGRMTVEEALPVALQVCDALGAAHQAGVLHRDIKPGNVFLVGKRALLIDFGLAAAVQRDASLTSAGVVIGTLAYVAPEQLETGKASVASDVYSLGVVLHEMLTGRKPHDSKSPFRLARQKAAEMHEGITRSSEIPAVWAEALTRCLKARPEQRYKSSGELRAALERSRPSVRFLVAKPAVWGPVAVALLAMLLWTGWSTWRRDYQPAEAAARLYDEAAAAMAQSAPARAVPLLERAMRLDERFVKAAALLAVAHAENDQVDRAREAILKATMAADQRRLLGRQERFALDAARAAVIRDFALAAEEYARWAGVAVGHERGNVLLFLGRMQDLGGKADEALATFELAVREEPRNASARIRLALQLCRRLKYPAAAEQFSAAEKVLRAEGNREGLTELLIARGALRSQTVTENRKDLEEAEAMAAQTGNRYHRLMLRFRRATLLQNERDYEKSTAITRETAEEARREGMQFVAARALGELGHTLRFARQVDRSIEVLQEAVAFAEEVKSQSTLAANRMRLGEALLLQERREEALSHMKPAVEWYRQARIHDVLPLILLKYGTGHPRLADRRPIYEEALQLATRQGDEAYQSLVLQRLTADLSYTDLRSSAQYARRLLPLARSVPNHNAMMAVAEVMLRFGLAGEAKLVADEVEADFLKYSPGVDRDGNLSRLSETYSEVARQTGDCATALRIHRASPPAFPERKVTFEIMAKRLEGCAPATPVKTLEQQARWLRESAKNSRWQLFAILSLIPETEILLRLKRWEAAKAAAEEGIALARQEGYVVYEMNLLMLLRASARRGGNDAGADEVTARARALATQLGFDEHFNGRKDLQALWRAGSE